MTRSARAARTLLAVAVLAGSAALVAACGTAVSTTSPPGTTSRPGGAEVTPVPSADSGGTPVAATGPAACATSALHVSVSRSGGVAAGSSYYPIVFTNVSAASCTLYGYPGVSFVTGAGGSQIGIPATENPAHPRKLITLSPGQAGHAELQVVDAQNYPPADCGVVTAHWLKVYPPNQTAPVYASFTAQACTKARPILTVETIQSGTTGA
jgi:hypothetical protein